MQSAQAQSPIDLLKQAVDAQGGVEALRAVKSVVVKGETHAWEPGQSFSINNTRLLGISTFTATVDIANSKLRYDWDRDMKYPNVAYSVTSVIGAGDKPPVETPMFLKYSEILLPAYGAWMDTRDLAPPASGSRDAKAFAEKVREAVRVLPMSGIRHATTMREHVRGQAWMGFLQLAALDAPHNVSAIEDQKLDDQTFPAIQYNHGPYTFIVLFDRGTKLPVSVRSRDPDQIWGDSNFDMLLSDWKKVGNINIAHTRLFKLGDIEIQRLIVKDVALNATIVPEIFSIPEAVKAAAPPSATGNVPYQWVLRRILMGRFMDSDAVYFPPGGKFQLVELAPNVQLLQGATINSLIVNMKDGIVVVDAPIDEGFSNWVINAAKQKYPGKPIKYLVITHHHHDHNGGMRTYAAEGATIIAAVPNKAYFERVVKEPHLLAPDALQKSPRPVTIQEVKDSFTLKDDTVQIDLHNIETAHVEGFLFPHIVKENIVFTPDLVTPIGVVPRNKFSIDLGNAMRKYHVTMDAIVAGGHGSTVKASEIEDALAPE